MEPAPLGAKPGWLVARSTCVAEKPGPLDEETTFLREDPASHREEPVRLAAEHGFVDEKAGSSA